MSSSQRDFHVAVEQVGALFSAITRLAGDETIIELARLGVSVATDLNPPSNQDGVVNREVQAPIVPLPRLTARQSQILRQLALGNSVKETAYQLNISPKTVATHRAQIIERLGIRDTAGLVVFAISHGLIDIRSRQAQWETLAGQTGDSN